MNCRALTCRSAARLTVLVSQVRARQRARGDARSTPRYPWILFVHGEIETHDSWCGHWQCQVLIN